MRLEGLEGRIQDVSRHTRTTCSQVCMLDGFLMTVRTLRNSSEHHRQATKVRSVEGPLRAALIAATSKLYSILTTTMMVPYCYFELSFHSST